jgi:Predicted membrane-bound mannosyltransferase
MFGVDVYWSHLLLVPLLWGVFVPVVAFMFSRMLGAKENIAVLSGLLVSLFPANIIWGTVSIPNGLSYLFFFCFLYFLLKYIINNQKRNLFIVAAFFFVAFLSHYLAGTIALALMLLAKTVKTYQTEKRYSPASAKFALLLAFIFSVSVLPFALANRRFFYPTANTYFSLQPLYERPFAETVLAFLFGRYFDLISRLALITSLIFGIATLVGLAAVVYLLGIDLKNSPKKNINPSLLFLTLALSIIIIDDRITRYFMMNVPFVEIDRLWVFRDFMLVPFVALFVGAIIQGTHSFVDVLSTKISAILRKIPTHRFSKTSPLFARLPSHKIKRLASTLLHVAFLLIVSGWIAASVYYAYPHWSPLQTTSYELEAVRYIETTTEKTYIVVCDAWMTFAGGMIVGIHNPQAYYFSSRDPYGITMFIEMKNNPTNETMKEAMRTNNATTAYFIIEKPRLGEEIYNRIIQQAQQNRLQTYRTFHYRDEEKLRIFYHKKSEATSE